MRNRISIESTMAVPFTKKKQKPKTAFFIEGRVSKENRGLDSEEIAQVQLNISLSYLWYSPR